jgi:O-antigen/teichoic acid export membrane protein
MVFVAVIVWVAALIFGVAGWWIPAAAAGLWATAIVGWLVFRSRPRHPIHPTFGPTGPPPAPPPIW